VKIFRSLEISIEIANLITKMNIYIYQGALSFMILGPGLKLAILVSFSRSNWNISHFSFQWPKAPSTEMFKLQIAAYFQASVHGCSTVVHYLPYRW